MAWPVAAEPPPLAAEDIHVWRADLDAADARLRACGGLLTPEEHERAARYAFDEPRRRFIVARGTLRALLAAYTGVAAADLTFTYGPYGKPALADPASDLRFNLSHSGGCALLAVTRGREVGVDVERTLRTVDWEAVSARFFEARERRDLLALPEGARRPAFFRCWTRKEAFMKATGHGVAYGLKSFAVTLAPTEPPALRWLAAGAPADWGVADADPDAEHVGAVCAGGRDWRPVFLSFGE